MAKNIDPKTQAIYHELCGTHGQTMTLADVMAEMHFSDHQLIRSKFPTGWIGSGRGLRMRTYDFAAQLVAMREE